MWPICPYIWRSLLEISSCGIIFNECRIYRWGGLLSLSTICFMTYKDTTLLNLYPWVDISQVQRMFKKVRFPMSWKLNDKSLQSYTWLVYSTEVSLFFNTQSLSTLMHLSDLALSLKILLQQKSGSWQATNHGPTISLFEQNMLKCSLSHWSNTGEWPKPHYSGSKKWSSLNGHKNKSLISAATQFLKSCQDWKNAPVCSAITLINDTSVNKWATLNFALTCHLVLQFEYSRES